MIFQILGYAFVAFVACAPICGIILAAIDLFK